MIMNIIGERSVDNRDSWGIKKLDPPGRVMEIKLNTIVTAYMNDFRTKISSTPPNQEALGVVSQNVASGLFRKITTTFKSSFSTVWTTQKGQTVESVTDSLKRDTPAAAISQITKLSAPTSRKGKNPAIRELQQSQLGFICIAETTENAACGIVKNLSCTCTISLDRDSDDFFHVMKSKIIPSYTGDVHLDWSSYVYILDSEDITLTDGKTRQDFSECEVEAEQDENESQNDYEIRMQLIKEEEVIKT